MKYIPEKYEDITKLLSWYTRGEISSEEYYEACNEFSKILVDRELSYERFKHGSAR